jgi:hypothetical protein
MIIAVPLMQALKGTPWLWRKDNILSNGKLTDSADAIPKNTIPSQDQ